MPQIRFTRDFHWTDPRMPRRTVAYKAGMVETVTTPCADAAKAIGAGVDAAASAGTGAAPTMGAKAPTQGETPASGAVDDGAAAN